jgi:glutamine amidotransferase
MSREVLVLDYGIGNLRSICHAFEHCGAEVNLSGDPRSIRKADRLILPGVGAIGDCLHELSQRGLMDELTKYSELERPFLGICVGMQLMLDISCEFGKHECLGWIEGGVVPIPATGPSGVRRKIPHIGWKSLEFPDGRCEWAGTVLSGIEPGSCVYFVHSYAAEPQNESFRLSEADYGGFRICAALSKGSLSGTQFHPEKSGPVGLQIIRNFIST